MAQKRNIFEEVSEDHQVTSPVSGGLIEKSDGGARGFAKIWLLSLFALVSLMIVIGGLTRLTDSGLSITEWKPFSGAFPPLSQEAWQIEFEKYRLIPEYLLQNEGMSLSEFKFIFWWEWGHRQLGRVVGLVWAIGYLGLCITRKVPSGWHLRFLLLGALGGLQGAIGWWMVSSGLEGKMVDVASYRLATHLGLAFIILGFIAWYSFLLSRSDAELIKARRAGDKKFFSLSTGVMHFAFLQIVLGALVAGIDAGRGYTDWPLMGGQILPPDALSYTPIWKNFFENAATVQFMHRMAGYLLLVFAFIAWKKGRKSANYSISGAFNLMLALMIFQVALGIITLINGAPLLLGISHQIVAILLFVSILRMRFYSRYPLTQSLR